MSALHMTVQTAALIESLVELAPTCALAEYIGVPVEGPYKPDHYKY